MINRREFMRFAAIGGAIVLTGVTFRSGTRRMTATEVREAQNQIGEEFMREWERGITMLAEQKESRLRRRYGRSPLEDHFRSMKIIDQMYAANRRKPGAP